MAVIAGTVHAVVHACRSSRSLPGRLHRSAIAMIAVLWTYESWYYVTYAAGEVKDAAAKRAPCAA